MSLFGNKNKGANISCILSHIEGIQLLPKNAQIKIELNDKQNRLEMSKPKAEDPIAFIDYGQFVSVDMMSEKEAIEKNKSSIGRAVAGGILLGPIGAIVGGISGTGTKKHTETKYFIIIRYKPTNAPSDINSIYLQTLPLSGRWDRLVLSLREKITPVSEPQQL